MGIPSMSWTPAMAGLGQVNTPIPEMAIAASDTSAAIAVSCALPLAKSASTFRANRPAQVVSQLESAAETAPAAACLIRARRATSPSASRLAAGDHRHVASIVGKEFVDVTDGRA